MGFNLPLLGNLNLPDFSAPPPTPTFNLPLLGNLNLPSFAPPAPPPTAPPSLSSFLPLLGSLGGASPSNPVTSLFSQAITPMQGSSSNPVSMLLSVLAMKQRQQAAAAPAMGGSAASGTGGLPGGLMGNINGPFNPQAYMNQFNPAQVPFSAMIALKHGNYPNTNGALWARPDVAAAFSAAAKAFHQQTGQDLSNYLVSGYRNFQSSSPKAISYLLSDHSMGGALDFAANSTADMWMRRYGPQYGFGNSGAGYNWNDPGHFSFTAGGFMGSKGDNWGLPTGTDAQWIALANQLFG